MTQVKICGVGRVEDALTAADAGADFLGLMFFKGSKRFVETDRAREIAEAVRGRLRLVGVFVNEEPEEMNRVARLCGLDYVQLSGDEPPAAVTGLDVPAIRAVHVRESATPEDLAERIESSPAELVLLDTGAAGLYGGSGRTFDWGLLPSLRRRVLLAGGLDPSNVGRAIERVRPWGVDVSSGVETEGRKDPNRIRDFVTRAKEWA